MRDFNRNNRSGGGRGRGGDFRGRGSGRGDREMHDAVCDECGKDCKVPFRPSGDKPIYCSNCFEGKEGGSSRRPSRRDSGGSDKQVLEQLTLLNTKLDRILGLFESCVKNHPSKDKKGKTKKVVKKAPKASKKKAKKSSS